MGEKIPSWQRRSQLALNQLFERKQFLDDLKLVKNESMTITDLLMKYSVPPYAVGYITHYINTGNKDYSRILPPFVMISEKTNEAAPSKMPHVEKVLVANDIVSSRGLYLLFQTATSKQELIDFIDTNWKSDIEPLIERHFGHKSKRVRTKNNLKRDESIYREREKGATLRELQDKYEMGYSEVSQILKRHKK